MSIKVRFFASLRETVGSDSMDICLASQSDLTGLLESIRHKLGDDAFAVLRGPNVRIAVNLEFVEGECTLRDGDEVAFMPPITGG